MPLLRPLLLSHWFPILHPLSPFSRRSKRRRFVAAPEDHLPLMIRWSNWRPEFGPAFVYAREADLNGMLQLDGPVEKMVMVTSYDELTAVDAFCR